MTTMIAFSLLVSVATAVICTLAPSPATAYNHYPCPWRTVPHPEEPFIQNLGSWAVVQQHVPMHFEKVESARLKGVGSCTTMTHNYYYEMILYAAIRGDPGHGGDADDYKYRAVVYVVNFTQPQKVITFRAIPPPSHPPNHPPEAN